MDLCRLVNLRRYYLFELNRNPDDERIRDTVKLINTHIDRLTSKEKRIKNALSLATIGKEKAKREENERIQNLFERIIKELSKV